MKVHLICSNKMQPVLRELLEGRNIALEAQADICVVESGCALPEDRLCIVFQPATLPALLELLGGPGKVDEQAAGSNKVIGRSEDENLNVIFHHQIHYFEGRGNSTFCITAEGEYRVREKLYELESNLPQDMFTRVGKSFIVNIENVSEIVPWFGRRLMLRFTNNKKVVEVSKNYVKSFKLFLGM